MHFLRGVFSLPLLILFFVVLLCSFLIWLKERKHFPDDFPQTVFRGIVYSFWYGFHAILSGDIFFEIKDTYSRFLTIIMLICSLILMSIAAASFTSALTITHLGSSSGISALDDLSNRPVAIIKGTDVKDYLQNIEAEVVQEDTLHLAVQSLKDDNVVAIVADKLVMNNYLKNNDLSNINITNVVVRSNILSFGMPRDFELRDTINDTIVHLQDSNWIYKMCLKYLSTHQASFCTL